LFFHSCSDAKKLECFSGEVLGWKLAFPLVVRQRRISATLQDWVEKGD